MAPFSASTVRSDMWRDMDAIPSTQRLGQAETSADRWALPFTGSPQSYRRRLGLPRKTNWVKLLVVSGLAFSVCSTLVSRASHYRELFVSASSMRRKRHAPSDYFVDMGQSRLRATAVALQAAKKKAVVDDSDDLSSLTVDKLKAMLRELGLPVSGKKADLISRLQAAGGDEDDKAAAEEEREEEASEEEGVDAEAAEKVTDEEEEEEDEEDEEEEEEEEEESESSSPARISALPTDKPEEPEKKSRGRIGDTLGAACTNSAATRRLPFLEEDPVKAAIMIKREMLATIGPPSGRVGGSRDGPYAKELCVLEHVLDTAKAGDPFSVTLAIENFGEGVLGASSQWLKVAGGAKKVVLAAGVCGAQPGTSVLEIGAYVGYSAIRMATMLPGVRVISLEVDPVHVVVARNVIALAGCSGKNDVWTGHSKDLLNRLPNRYGGPGELLLSACFMDQKGSRYTEDLDGLEREGLIRPGSIVVADNVLKPGAPTYLWHTLNGPSYVTQILRVGEFAMPSEDWISISAMRFRTAPKRPKGPIYRRREEEEEVIDVDVEPDYNRTWLDYGPEKLPEYEREADRMRTRARRPGRSVTFPEWAEFAQGMVKKLANHDIYATGAAPLEEDGARTKGWQRKRLPKRR